MDRFLEQEPPPIDRVEIAVARFMTMYKTIHQPDSAKAPKLDDFLPHLRAWPTPQQDSRYSDLDREYLNELL